MASRNQSAVEYIKNARTHLLNWGFQNISVIVGKLYRRGVFTEVEVSKINSEKEDFNKTRTILDWVINKGEAACYELLKAIDKMTRKRTFLETPVSEEVATTSMQKSIFDLHHWISCFFFIDVVEIPHSKVWSIDLSKRKVSDLLEALKLQPEKKPVRLTGWNEESEVRILLQCLPYISQLSVADGRSETSETTKFLGKLICEAAEREEETGEKILELLSSVCNYKTFPFINWHDDDDDDDDDDDWKHRKYQCDVLLDLYSYVKNYETQTGRSVLPALQPVYQSVPAVWSIDFSDRKVSLLLEVLKLQPEKKPVELRVWSDEESEMRIFLQCLPYISRLSIADGRSETSKTTKFLGKLISEAAELEEETGEKFLELLSSVCNYKTFPLIDWNDDWYDRKYQCDVLLDLYSYVKNYETRTGRSVLPALQLVYQSSPAVWYIDLSKRKVSLLLEVMKLQPEKKPVELRGWLHEESEVRIFLQCLPYISQLSVATGMSGSSETTAFLGKLICKAAEREKETGKKILELLYSVCNYKTFPFIDCDDEWYNRKYQCDVLLILYSYVKNYETRTGRSVLPALKPVYQSAPAVWSVDLSERNDSLLLEVMKLQPEKKPVELADWSYEESEVRIFLQCLPYISQLRCSKACLLQLLSLVSEGSERNTVMQAGSLAGALCGELDLSETRLDQKVCRCLALVLEHSEGLRELDLSHCQLTDQLLETLIPHLHKAQVLDLSHNNLTDALTDRLLQLLTINTSIQTVRLFNNCFKDTTPFLKDKRFEMLEKKKETDSDYDDEDDVASTKPYQKLHEGPTSQDSPREIVTPSVAIVSPLYPMLPSPSVSQQSSQHSTEELSRETACDFSTTDHPVTESLSSPHPSLELKEETDLSRCFSGLTMGESSSLPRSRSLPSMSQSPCIENKASFTAKRSHSLNDVTLLYKTQKITPDIIVVENKETYSFHCTQAGLFQCSLTGLVFKMETEGDVTYRTVPWNRRLLKPLGKRPAGPLFDTQCPRGSVCQLHLPHCEILSMGGGKSLSVVHVMDEGIELIKPDVITETHVIINITGFSPYGVVVNDDSSSNPSTSVFFEGAKKWVRSFFVASPIHALVLLFYAPLISTLKVLLLPGNVVLREVRTERRSIHPEEIYIEKPPCKLIPNQDYILTSSQDDSIIIQPKKTTFEVDESSYKNYVETFEVILKGKCRDHVRLLLKPLSHSHEKPVGDSNTSDCAWDCYVSLPAPDLRRQQVEHMIDSPEDRLFSVRGSLIQSISAPCLKCVVDKLFEKRMLTDSELEEASGGQAREEMARFVIDTVRRKGPDASSSMILILCDIDPFLSKYLGLMM